MPQGEDSAGPNEHSADLPQLRGEQVESVICYAWNSRIDEHSGKPKKEAFKIDDSEVLDEDVSTHGKMTDAVCAKYYLAYKDTYDGYVDAMQKYQPLAAAFKSGQHLDKLPAKDAVTDVWKKYG